MERRFIMKKVCSCFIMLFCFLLIFELAVPVYAAEATAVSLQQTAVNEFDLYNSIINTPEATLLKQGYTSDQIESFKAINFEDLIYQRAQFTDFKLKAMGYSEEEINLLRNYNGSYVETRALAGTLSADINIIGTPSAYGFVIRYEWSWNHSPFINATDAMGIRWLAFAEDGDTADVSTGTSYTKVYYKRFKY